MTLDIILVVANVYSAMPPADLTYSSGKLLCFKDLLMCFCPSNTSNARTRNLRVFCVCSKADHEASSTAPQYIGSVQVCNGSVL